MVISTLIFVPAFNGSKKPSTLTASATARHANSANANLSINENVQDAIVDDGNRDPGAEVLVVAKKEVTCRILDTCE